MYLKYWGLNERPFQNTYNPAYLYPWEGHEEVLSRLRYGLEGGRGLVLVTGPTGCGKSFLCRAFAEGAQAKGTRICMIANPIDDPDEILHQIRGGLGIDSPVHTRADLFQSIEDFAAKSFRRGERTLVLIDDAHLITSGSIPRELRQLLNLEERGTVLINLVLAGQDPLEEGVQGSAPLAQRVALRARVDPLPPGEVPGYVASRLKVAGMEKSPFKKNAIAEIAVAAGGIPRGINDLCDVALLSCWGRGKREIGKKDIETAVGDVVPVGEVG